jgi:hypothetical protein
LPIPYRVDDLEKVPEAFRGLYTEKNEGGKISFIAQVEGVSPKDVVDDFRTNNIALREQNEALLAESRKWQEIGAEPDVVKASMLQFQELKQKIEGKELIAAEGFQKAVETKVGTIKDALGGRVSAMEKRALEAEAKAHQAQEELRNFRLDTEIQASAIDVGVRAKAMLDVRGRARLAGWTLDEKGTPILKDGNGIVVLGTDGYPLSLREWMSGPLYEEAEHVFDTSKGGGAPGSNGGSLNGSSKYPYNPWEQGRKPNLTLRSQILSENPALADQMKRQAGYTKAI